MASLFNGVNNHLFIKLCQVINAVQNGETLTRSQLIARLKSDDFNYEYAADTKTEETLADYFFIFDTENGAAECRLLDEIPFFLTNDEKFWICSLLQDKQFDFVLSGKLHEKMKKMFSGEATPSLTNSWIRLQRNSGAPIAENKRQCLQTILQALRELKNITCLYTDNETKSEKAITGSPCRLEYDLAKNEYALLLWEENELTRIPVVNLSEVALLTTDKPADTEDKFQAFLNKHLTKVRLEIQDKNNAIERCFAMFSSYDKDAWRSDDGKYLLEVNYYDFDYPEIRRNILSLGSAVTVLQPESIATDILTELKGMYERYREL